MNDPMSISDSELVAGALRGDAEAFGVLVERYAPAIHALAYVKVRNREDARDVVQQALFTAYVNLHKLEQAPRFGAWLKGIVANKAWRILERRSRDERYAERFGRVAPEPNLADELVTKDRARAVLDALAALDETHREVVTLFYLQGMSVAEVAALSERAPGSVKRMLFEARAALKKELLDMGREEFASHQLPEEYRRRLSKIGAFPSVAPDIAIAPLEQAASPIRTLGPYGTFIAIRTGSEACFADYDYPSRKLTSVSHARAEDPILVDGEAAYPLDHLVFSDDREPNWIWRPCYRVTNDEYVYCAKQSGGVDVARPLLTPSSPGWNEPESRPQSLNVTPGTSQEPDGVHDGWSVGAKYCEVHVGGATHVCVRRVTGGGKWKLNWSPDPVSVCATEEYFLTDGRLLLWRRYNGQKWSEQDPGRAKDARGTYERLAEAGVPSVEAFGETYYLWYDQIPDYALAT